MLTGSVKFVGQPYYFHHRDYLSGLALDHQECDSSNDPSARLIFKIHRFATDTNKFIIPHNSF